ncbi:hypothetical protein ACNKHK_16605 [Shigella flexneri]
MVLRQSRVAASKKRKRKSWLAGCVTVLDNINDEAVNQRIKGKVLDICARYPVYA